MGSVNVNIAGREYSLACRDGEEPRRAQLALHLSEKADELTGSLGQMSEPRLLLMTGILVADELFDLRATPAGAAAAAAAADPQLGEMITQLAERMERLAESLEAVAGAP